MHTLIFKTEDIAQLAKATEAHRGKQFKIPYTDETTEDVGFWLVKDDGIYVMSAFKTKDGSPIVAYADGYDPSKYDCYEEAHYVSADDFAEFVPISDCILKLLLHHHGDLEIGLTETELQVNANNRRKLSKKLNN